MRKFLDKLVIMKWHITLGYSTIGTIGIGLVIAKTVQDILTPYVNIPILILFPIGITLLWITGYLYDKLGFFSKESEYATELNTYFKNKFKD